MVKNISERTDAKTQRQSTNLYLAFNALYDPVLQIQCAPKEHGITTAVLICRTLLRWTLIFINEDYNADKKQYLSYFKILLAK